MISTSSSGSTRTGSCRPSGGPTGSRLRSSTFLPDGETWKGRISARGALPAGAFVRIVFGPFIAVADPPKGMDERVIWITDHALELGP